MSDILISGYYGFKNSGDDALLLTIIRDLKKYKKDINPAVLSKTPAETSEIYGVRAINRMNPLSVLFNMMRCKMLLSGGGTLIQDGTSTKSLLYYLAIIKLAHILGKKVMLYSNGIGPLREEHKNMTRKILNKADIITLRDAASKAELDAIGVDKPKIILTADPAFNLECKNPHKAEEILSELGIGSDEKFICVSVRSWQGMKANFHSELAKALDYIQKKYHYRVLFLPMQPARDREISEKVMSLMETPCVCLAKATDIDSILAVTGRCELCIGMRLHSLIYAVSSEVPVIGLVYDVKVAGFMDYINQKYYLPADSLTSYELMAMADECMENMTSIKKELLENLAEIKEKAELNARYAIDLLEESEGKRR